MFGLLDSLPWDEGELGKEGKGRQTLFIFELKAMVRFNLECISEHPISQSGQCAGRGQKKFGEGGGRKKNRGLNNRWWWMEIRFTFSARGEQMLCWNWPYNSPVCRLRRKVWGSQPCLPRGPPCLRRQDPSSVSKAIFTNAWKLLLLSLRLSCEGMKHRQIPSLETRQSQHLVYTLCRSDFCAPKTLSILHKTVFF